MHRVNPLTLNYSGSRLKRHMKVIKKKKKSKRGLRYFPVHSIFPNYLNDIYTKSVKSVFAPKRNVQLANADLYN